MSTKLTLNEINKLHKSYDEQQEIIVTSDNKSYTIKIDKKFKRTKIAKMISELEKIFTELKKDKDINIEEISKNIIFIQVALILKYFTDIPLIKNTNISQMLAIIEKLTDLGLLKQIFDSFDQQEMKILNDEMELITQNYKAISNMVAEMLHNAEMNKNAKL